MKDLKQELQTYLNPTETTVVLYMIKEWVMQHRNQPYADNRLADSREIIIDELIEELK